MRPTAKGELRDAHEASLSAEVAAVPSSSGLKPWLPALAAVVLAPVVTFAVSEWLLIPRLQSRLAVAEASLDKKTATAHGQERAEGKGQAPEGSTFDYKDVVVNLAGTMGTRYLKTSFVVTGKGVRSAFEGDKARLADVTLSLLSSITMADLEQAGAKNVLRGKLVNAYNQALGKHVVDQVYFSDFVIQ